MELGECTMKPFASGLLAAVLLSVATAATAVVPHEIETFENYASGKPTVFPFNSNDPDYGILSGGAVRTPGTDIDAAFQLGGNRVYAGTNLTYTTYLGPDLYHCCGFFWIGMDITSPTGVTVEFWGHGADLEYPSITLMFSTVVTGQNVFLSFGNPGIPDPEGPYQSDIVEVRWYTDDGSLFAIDNFQTAGMAAIPEPASWALMIAGFGLAGAALRLRAVSPA